jgi:type IV secretory pathway TrbF-like protein
VRGLKETPMTAPDDATLAYWSEHRSQLRQSENQRSVLTNYVLTIAAAISGFVVQQHFRVQTLPLSVLVVLIGLYGALSAAKYHERANYHLGQARALTQVLAQSGALSDDDAILERFRLDHYRHYPRLSRVRLHWLWTGLHLGVAAYGLVLIILTVTEGS